MLVAYFRSDLRSLKNALLFILNLNMVLGARKLSIKCHRFSLFVLRSEGADDAVVKVTMLAICFF